MKRHIHGLILLFSCVAALPTVSAAQKLELRKDDHISIIGNALPDRMQHAGWLETLINAQFPQHDLVFRNLAVAGDEVVTRHRSENFGSPDDWLTKTKADVILAFFGFNESFKGEEGLDKFKRDLDKFLKETKAKNYSGRGTPQIVLFSPIANEKLKDPNYPDPQANNERIEKYAAAMAEVAKVNGVPFVDLFPISRQLYAQRAKRGRSLTFNGLHLTEEGDKLLAPEIFRELFGEPVPSGNLEKLRAAVNDKNAEWHARYRTVDGYNVYGGRSALAYQPGQGKFISNRQAPEPYVSNYKVMQEEMNQRDLKTANRDRRVWAVAKGGDVKVDDANLPAVTKVQSNKAEVQPFLSGEEAIAHMKVPKGCKVTLFASEEKFPELVSPVQMAFDTKGRLWVAAWPSYPERTPTDTVADKLLIFEDTDNDGKADKVITFLDGLNCPTGFQFYKDGVLVMQAPDLWFVRDTNGDDRGDWKERVLMGLDSADSHHTANAMVLDPGGATYLSDGVFHRTQVETALGPVRNDDGCIYRFEPRTGKFERYVPYNFANPHGRVFDYWGNDLITDATGNATYFGPAFSGFLEYPARHASMKEFWKRPSRPCPGTGILSSRHFPEEFQGNFLNLNVIGFQGIFRVKVTEDGSGLKGETIEDHLVQSDDPNFRPSAIDVAPDGSLYFLDWAKPLIGHMQHHIRDPNRDKSHGRIYRITYEGRPLLKPAKIDGQPINKLLDLLKEPEDNVRLRAKIEIGQHDSPKVIAAVKKWAAKLDKNDKDYEHHMLEALWMHQWHNVVDEGLLLKTLRSPDYHARAAATRVLCYWRDRVKDPLALLQVQATDEHPRVRIEAIRACSFFKTSKAAEVALAALDKEANPDKPDYYIKYCLDETMKALDKYTK
ncbi:MAG: GDSL-type esterase/lipase family protein [Verrucomicrobiales bacterium]|nr:GDSL-type esterase/lipase family protein [Verrucomicrobiales bacterium]